MARAKKNQYVVHHNSYTSAVQAAEAFAVANGYEVNDEQMSLDIGLKTRRPKIGETTRFDIHLFKEGKEQRKSLHAQVYCMTAGESSKFDSYLFELNMYIL